MTRASADLSAKAVVVFSETGRTARLVAANRPPARILTLSSHEPTLARTCLYHGVRPQLIHDCISLPRQLAAANAAVQETGLAEPGDIVIIVGGTIPGRSGATNRMYIHTVTA